MKHKLSAILLPLSLFFVLNEANGQCTVGCDVSHTICAAIASIPANGTGTVGNNYIVCISPPAGCGTITVGNVVLDAYQRLVVCTNSPTDTVKFTGNFGPSGGGGAAANDNTRFIDIYGNAQITFGGTVNITSRIVLNIASTGSLRLKNSALFTFQNTSTLTNAGKIISTTDMSFDGPVNNTGYIYSGNNMSFLGNSGLTNTTTGIVETKATLNFATGLGVVNDGNLLAGCNLNITAGSFDNNNYVYSGCNTIVSTAISNNAKFNSAGTLTLNASGTFLFQNGLFEVDTLILNGGNIDAGTGCAVFMVNKLSSIQNGSGFTSVPANSVAIYDTGNPGKIDNVSCGCTGTDADGKDDAVSAPSVACGGRPLGANSAGPYCGIVPISAFTGGPGGCFATLPVVWDYISAKRTSSSANVINWTVEENENNLMYEVQYSLDGVSFEAAGFVNPISGTNQARYSFNHSENSSGIVYYRIKQIDKNGTISYSSIVEVNGSANNVNVFPNPGSDLITIHSHDEINAVDVINVNGQLLFSKTLDEKSTIDVSQLIKGIYLIKTYSENGINYTKFEKQ